MDIFLENFSCNIGTRFRRVVCDGNQGVYGAATTIKIMSAKVVNSVTNVDLAADPAVTSGTSLGIDDFTIIAYNKFGGT